MKSTDSIVNTLETRVRARVSAQRMVHIQRVAELAEAIGQANGLDGKQCYLAGLLHDVARDLDNEELFRLAPVQDDLEQAHPIMLHGRAGRALAESWGVHDPEVLDAIVGHVTGARPENSVAMAVFVADSAEPHRGVNDEVRQLALSGHLLEAYARTLKGKIDYLNDKGDPVHPRTLAAYAALRKHHADR